MEGSAIIEIAHLARRAGETREIDGRVFLPESMNEVKDPRAQHPTIQTESLLSIPKYIEAEVQSPIITGSRVAIVHNPWQVSFDQINMDERGKSSQLVQCTIELKHPIRDTQFMNGQAMVLQLYESFVLDNELEELMAIASDLKSEVSVQEVSGNRWQVKRSTGVETPGFKEPKPIYWLQPRCTFPEVPAPQVPYALSFRVRGDALPEIRLVSAGGDTWRVEAINNIRTWLESSIDYPVI